MPVIRSENHEFEFSYPVVVIGAGGCGLTAALAVRDAGLDVLVIERESKPHGTTSMSTGLIPAAGTPEQKAAGIEDSPELMAADIMAKTGNRTDPVIVGELARQSGETVAWLRDKHNVPLGLVDGFLYPGHSVRRMYGTPKRHGNELMTALETASTDCGVDVLTDALARDLFVDANDRVVGVTIERPDGTVEEIGCQSLVLACCGFGGSPEMVQKYIPELTNATFHGHPGNKGDAILWGEELGASLVDMSAYQGHGGLAVGYAVPILWPFIVEGGFQVNRLGKRFSDESKGYSEQAMKIVAQPEHVAYSILDQRLYDLMMQFEDFQQAVEAGAVMKAESIEELAQKCRVPADALAQTFADVDQAKAKTKADEFGRDFNNKPALAAPFYAVRVTGALFHTQGGLEIDTEARVLHKDGRPFPNLFAGGGAARGISGPDASGYIAGNGLLTATTLGKIAGRVAAAQVLAEGS